jgi:DNA-binding beta-propeller fold protein YncE
LRGAYQAQLSRCMKEGNFADCETESDSILEAQQGLRATIANPSGDCAEAVDGGVPISSFGPDTCPPAGARCDESVGAIADLDDLAECLVCMQAGFDASLRLRIDLPLGEPPVQNERKCIRAVASRTLKAIRAGVRDVERCAAGGVAPFSCPSSADPESKFGKALSRIAVAVSRCKDASGVPGQLSGDSAATCRPAAAAPADLTECHESVARCIVCSHANGVFDQSQDCVTYSGGPCRGMLAARGTSYVTNEADDSVTYFSGAHAPLHGTLAASTFAAGNAPAAVAVNQAFSIVYVANSADDSVTFLDASTGGPIYGSLAASTFAVGDDPQALAVDEPSDILYVANRGSDTVTMLNALSGLPYFGTVPASTLAVGDEPRALMHSTREGIVYVANFGSDSVTMLDADTGVYRLGTFAASTGATGDGPVAFADNDHDEDEPNIVHVVNYNDSTVTYLNAETLEPRLGMLTVADSSLAVGTGPRAAAISEYYYLGSQRLVHVASEDGTVTLLKTNPSAFGQYVQAERPNATFAIASAPSAMAFNPAAGEILVAHPGIDTIGTIGELEDWGPSQFRFTDPDGDCVRMYLALDAADNRLYVSCNSGVAVLDATTGAFAFGSEANSFFHVSDLGLMRSMALDAANDVLYVGGYEVAASTQGVAWLDALTGASISPFTTATGTTSPWDIEFSPSLDRLYAADYTVPAEPLYIIDVTTGGVIGSPASGLLRPILLNEAEGILYGRVGINPASIRFLDATDGSPLFGTDLNSTFAAGSYIEDLALDAGADLLYVVNAYAEVVRVLDALTGAYAFGSEAASTFDTGVPTLDIALDPSSTTLFAHSGGKLTRIDSMTGVPVGGSFSNSSLDTLDNGPVAVNTAADRLYVANEEYSSVTYYRLSTGAFLNTNLPMDSFVAGDAPSAIAVME